MLDKLKNRLRALSSSSFLRNIGKMMTGTGFAHLLGVLIIPVLTRLYTPDEIGLYASYLSMFTILYSVASLRFEYATLIPRTQREANNVTALATVLVTVFSVLLLAVLLAFGPAILALLGQESLGRLIYLLPVSVFAYAMFMVLVFSHNRVRTYGDIARGKILGSVSVAGLQTGFGWQAFNQTGLVLGKTLGDVAGMAFLAWKRWKLGTSVRAGVTPRRMMAMAKRYRKFPVWNAPHALTTSASNNIPVLLFSSYFSEAIAGFYAMAVKALYSPVQVVAQAAYQVFSQRIAAKYAAREELLPFMRSTLLLLGGVGVVPFVILFFVSPALFSWFLGPDYRVTGEFVQILTPFIFLVFVMTPLNFIPLMLGEQKKAFFLDVLYLLLRLGALVTGIVQESITLALMLYSGVGVVYSLFMVWWFFSLVRRAG
ncbi:MAG: Membrane protein involved in the export of O-antigen and teichoic acid [Bacteroidetes bacterium HLUCCA01]|nr:MAG: Membrane protein involved in the export of O-antigen and teichoic acid [Bacteroidetes bacterium HLUCCA01]